MTRQITNVAASVRDRLLALTKQQRGDFQRTLRRYLVERFLYRLGVSPYRDHFVLKGAMLFVLWDAAVDRPTKDLDLAGFWTGDAASLVAATREIVALPCAEDGITFAADVTSEPIRQLAEYHGFRLRVTGELAAARISLQVDVGFGDAIEPPAVLETYPVLLDAPPPRIRAYPREASIAEKLHAMVTLGLENTRFKDFYDVYLLSARFAFDGARVTTAIAATFQRRKTGTLEAVPAALSSAFYQDPERATQWQRFLQRTKLGADAPADFARVGTRVCAFLGPALRAAQGGSPHVAAWPPGGPWQ